MQRRIFFSFGASIVVTGFMVAMVFRLLSPTERFQRDAEGFSHFVSHRIEAVWDDPTQRDALVYDIHRDLSLDATLFGADGQVLSRHGGACAEPWGRFALTREDGRSLGSLEVCGEPYRYGGWRFILVLLLAMGILWAASGAIARRLLRPLRRLERLARQIGDGDLSARAHLDPYRHGEFGMLGVTMDEMAERIEKQLADQRELLAAVSHELRTPLGHLRVLIEMGREKTSDKLIDEIEMEVMEVDALVGQLLASSRVDFGSLHEKAIDPVHVMKRALSRAELDPEELEVIGERQIVSADPTLLARALANLIRNAEQHGGGVARRFVRYRETDVIFGIEDGGPGFGAEERERVFEPFFRGEQRAGGSLGLGLSLVRRIAEAHGGRAWVEDVPDGGARVLFSVSTAPVEGA